MPRSSEAIQKRIQQFTGAIWYVATTGNDSDSGISPISPLLTITAAIAKAAAGDQIVIAGGAYTEDVAVNKDRLVLTGENATIIIGTVTLANDFVLFTDITINPVAAQALIVSGDLGNIQRVSVGGTSTIGIAVTGYRNIFRDIISGGHSVTGFDIKGAQTILRNCDAGGLGGAQRGYYISEIAAAACLLENCTSVANGTSGFTALSSFNVFRNCNSGGGDGPRVGGTGNTWPGYEFENRVDKEITFTTVGAQAHNLFKVSGSIHIKGIWADVEAAISSNMTGYYYEVYDGTTSTLINKNDGVLSALPENSLAVKTGNDSKTLDVHDATDAGLIDGVASGLEAFRVIQKTADVDTYIRLMASTTDDPPSGVIHTYVEWEPISGDGFLEAV